jgi:hypothetical protein
MTNNSADENDRLMRRFESDLDSYHNSLPLMRRNPGPALYAVMAAYDSMFLPLREVSAQMDETAIGSRQAIRAIVQSINPALLWITSEWGAVCPDPAADVPLIDDGGNFLTHAREYFQLSAFHIMYSRGLMSVECDEEKRLVRFVRPTTRDFPDGFASAVVSQRATKRHDCDREQVTLAFMRWLSRASYRLERGRIHFTGPRALANKEIIDIANLFAMPEALELSDETDLIGFTMGEFRRFWLGLHGWSIAATELYLRLVDNGVAQERCMPTQIVSEREFFDTMSYLTELEPQVLESITSRLSYDVSDLKRDVFLQPLLSSSGSISWCPLWIKQSRPERNMLKLMSRSGTLGNAAATIIGSRERQMLNELGLLLAKKGGYDYKLNRLLRHEGQSSEVDLLAYNRKAPTEVLLVEAKAVLAVDDVAEVQSATEHFIKAQTQLERAIRILISMSNDRKRLTFPFVDWAHVTTYRPLVVTPDSTPLAQSDHNAVPVITLELIRTQLRNREFNSPTAIWEASQRKEWLNQFNLESEDFYSSIRIGVITYEVPARGVRSESEL